MTAIILQLWGLLKGMGLSLDGILLLSLLLVALRVVRQGSVYLIRDLDKRMDGLSAYAKRLLALQRRANIASSEQTKALTLLTTSIISITPKSGRRSTDR